MKINTYEDSEAGEKLICAYGKIGYFMLVT